MNRKKKLSEEDRRAYVDGLRRLQERGVRVLIDGQEADDSLWGRLFEGHADGSFYMGDYIMEDLPAASAERICEPIQPYEEGMSECFGMKRCLKEVRFEMVYHDRPRRKKR